jgi:hypothetical protein
MSTSDPNVARRQREHLRCTQCSWVGITTQGKIRLGIFATSLATVAVLITLELTGVLALGDQVWAVALTILVVSIGVRLVIRGDRCGECGAPATVDK